MRRGEEVTRPSHPPQGQAEVYLLERKGPPGTGGFLSVAGGWGPGSDGIILAKDGTIYVSDTRNRRVKALDATGLRLLILAAIVYSVIRRREQEPQEPDAEPGPEAA